MPDTYDYITLMCRLKAAQTRNKELESDERYVKLKELHQKDCRDYEHKILELQTELAEAHKETGTYAAGNPSSTARRSP